VQLKKADPKIYYGIQGVSQKVYVLKMLDEIVRKLLLIIMQLTLRVTFQSQFSSVVYIIT